MNIKENIKKILLLCAFLFFFIFQSASATSLPVNAYFFYGEGCPHCAQEKPYLSSLKNKYSSLTIKEFEIYHNQENVKLMQDIASKINANVTGIPFLVIGDKYFVGYTEGITSTKIEERVKECSLRACVDIVSPIIENHNNTKTIDQQRNSDNSSQENLNQENSMVIKIPLFGNIDVMKFSLPVLTVLIGILDGFNPCAMWTLLFLISLLLGMKDKKRMWLLGSTFIVASAFVYFLFMAAWLNLIIFLGFVIWVRIVIGIIALVGGGYSLREFMVNKTGGCSIETSNKKKKVFDRIRSIVGQKNLLLSLVGIILLAFAVNLVELVCSAGLPAIYTQVLALSNLPTWQYYLYILSYIFFFMLDDLIVFFIAMITLEMTGVTTKYVRASRLIGGLLMLAIGLMLIFKPEWLMFG
ncbi:hypothetical protein M0R01_03400 [bacterium]|nr:hypothetical protein [bacterium]